MFCKGATATLYRKARLFIPIHKNILVNKFVDDLVLLLIVPKFVISLFNLQKTIGVMIYFKFSFCCS